jgi:hydrogenase-4 membrane subunit HyfE
MQLQNQWKPNNFNMAFRLFLTTLYLVMYLTQVVKLVIGFLGEEEPRGCRGLQPILAGFLKDCSSRLAT